MYLAKITKKIKDMVKFIQKCKKNRSMGRVRGNVLGYKLQISP